MAVIMMVTLTMFYADNRAIVFMAVITVTRMLLDDYRTVMMTTVVIATIVYAHADASGANIQMLSDRYGGNCNGYSENNSEWRNVSHLRLP